ncbi:MAG TPA: hypothetical protein RMH99_18050, partial [Sandaracinaceae bacterium LLY-WYZ-13_1]|nr:hypothetical protein [Sandaracinaceae bacterium LLY-WYZ-13_1]
AIDTYGVLDVDGYEASARLEPTGQDGEELAMRLREQLRASGVLDLVPGCYGDAGEVTSDDEVVTLVFPHQGRVHQWALTGDGGPVALIDAIELVRAYADLISEGESPEGDDDHG